MVQCLHHLVVYTKDPSFANVTLIREGDTENNMMAASFVPCLLDLSSDKEKNRTIRQLALETLYSIYKPTVEYITDMTDICAKSASRRAVASLLPGIVTAMAKIITGDYKQGHKIVVLAFKVLSVVITKAMSDSENHHLLQDSSDPLASLRQYTKDAVDIFSPPKRKKEYKTPFDQPLDTDWLQVTSTVRDF
jgi:hypothetical protein